MNVEIIIGELDSRWRERVSREIDLKFASAGSNVRLLIASLRVLKVNEGELYTCEIEARLRSGKRRKVETQGGHPNICIADAAARLARSIRRDNLFAPSQAVRGHL